MEEPKEAPTRVETVQNWLREAAVYPQLETFRSLQQQAIEANPDRVSELPLVDKSTRDLDEMPICLNLPRLAYTPAGYVLMSRYVTVYPTSGESFIMPHRFFWDFQHLEVLCLTPFQFAFHTKPLDVQFHAPGDAARFVRERVKGSNIRFAYSPCGNAAMLATLDDALKYLRVEYI